MRQPQQRKSIEEEEHKASSKCPFTSAFVAPHLLPLVDYLLTFIDFDLPSGNLPQKIAVNRRCNPSPKTNSLIFQQKIMNFLRIFSPHNAEENCAPFFLSVFFFFLAETRRKLQSIDSRVKIEDHCQRLPEIFHGLALR